jgi:nicotinamidase-related amidase
LVAVVLAMLAVSSVAMAAVAVQERTINDEWDFIAIPPAPELKPVALEVSSTAFLILDIQDPLCTKERPRCAASVPKIAAFLTLAREKGMTVAYSLTPTGKPEQIIPAVAPWPGDPIVKSSVDKFFNTDLEKHLKERGIKTVVIVGTAANGAVLHTAVAAAMRGMQVVIPVEGMTAIDPYAEQYTAWHMMNGPGTRNRATVTRFSMISFK